MKNNLFKIYVFAFFLMNGFVMFAQPGDDDTGGILEGDDAPVAPIDSKLILLALVGIVFAVYTFRNKNNRKRA
jgi:mannose/fructose/N-acetylgalactosamine-specific phosphotransferase system component IIC